MCNLAMALLFQAGSPVNLPVVESFHPPELSNLNDLFS